jgi:hypothetical protein
LKPCAPPLLLVGGKAHSVPPVEWHAVDAVVTAAEPAVLAVRQRASLPNSSPPAAARVSSITILRI